MYTLFVLIFLRKFKHVDFDYPSLLSNTLVIRLGLVKTNILSYNLDSMLYIYKYRERQLTTPESITRYGNPEVGVVYHRRLISTINIEVSWEAVDTILSTDLIRDIW